MQQPVDLTTTQLASLLRVNQQMGGLREREPLVPAFAEAAADLLPAGHILVLLAERGRSVVHLYRAPEANRVFAVEEEVDAPFPEWKDGGSEPLRLGSPADLRQRFPAGGPKLAQAGVESALLVPLAARGQVLGALGFAPRTGSDLDALGPQLLSELAHSLASALENCRAHEEQERLHRESAVLLDVNRTIGRHLRRDDLFGAMAACLQQLLPTQRFGIELPFGDDKLQGHLLTPRGGSVEPTQPHVLPAAGTVCDWVLCNRSWMVTATREELRERFPGTFQVMTREGMESLVAMPLVAGDHCRAVLFCMAVARGAYGSLRREFLEQVAAAVAVALDNCLAHEEVERLSRQLAADNAYLQEEIRSEHNFGEIVGNSTALLSLLRQAERVAETDCTVLICGETGTGKELIARAIHDRSRRKSRPLVKVNCAAISAGLVESELFGHVKGAFTGASGDHDGRFKLADGGTIFLDEVGELPPETQVKLLRVLQEHEFEPVGSNQSVKVDVRVIAATNRDLDAAVREGRFRSDLFYRLNVFPIHVPPLRERPGDVRLLVSFFVQELAKKMGKPIRHVPEEVMHRLTSYSWPGNIRELQNIIERGIILSTGATLELPGDFRSIESAAAVPSAGAESGASGLSPTVARPTSGHPGVTSLQEIERRHIEAVLARTNGLIEGEQGAAKILNLNPSTLRSRMQKLGIKRPGRTA
jgi:transcriptional regulator with GAF, ATPase, and Fis domain